MSQEREPLLSQLNKIVYHYRDRGTVGRMVTEHVIFIPTQLMLEQSEETEQFIRVAKDLNQREEFGCVVQADKVTHGDVSGVEFVFSFSESTQFDSIIGELESQLDQ